MLTKFHQTNLMIFNPNKRQHLTTFQITASYCLRSTGFSSSVLSKIFFRKSSFCPFMAPMHATHMLRQGLVVHGGVGLHHIVLRRTHWWQQRLKQTMPNILLDEARSITSVGSFSISPGILGNLSLKLTSALYFNFPPMPRATSG